MIRLYCADVTSLNNDGLFKEFASNISDYRREKLLRMHFRKDKNLSLGATVLLDVSLSHFGYRERDMQYGETEKGKPYFKDLPDVHFNISHSGTVVLVAVSDGDIGCDIEAISDIDLKIAKRYFCEDEYNYIMSFDNEQNRQNAFFRLWTLKESFMKLSGQGFSLPLNEFCIIPGETVKVKTDTVGKYRFFEFGGISGYRAAVCTEKIDEKPQLKQINLKKPCEGY